MNQIATALNEVNASIIKDFLISKGIQASYAANSGYQGHVSSCTIYCIAGKEEEALKLLKEEGLIK